jgi:hypothetical protein
MSYLSVTLADMSTKTADDSGYVVEGWYWDRFRASAVRAARKFAKRKGLKAEGDPQVHVVLVWPQEQAESVA